MSDIRPASSGIQRNTSPVETKVRANGSTNAGAVGARGVRDSLSDPTQIERLLADGSGEGLAGEANAENGAASGELPDPEEPALEAGESEGMQRLLLRESGVRTQHLASSSPATEPDTTSETGSTAKQASARFVDRLSVLAEDREAFQRVLTQAFGSVEPGATERLRQLLLNGDTSWLPSVKLIASDDRQMLGAYSTDEQTVFLNDSVMNDPQLLDAVMAEEFGHHLQTLVRSEDSPGDEGAAFAALLGEELVDTGSLNAMRQENDHGILQVEGRDVEVEFRRWTTLEMLRVGGPIEGGQFVQHNGEIGLRVSTYQGEFDIVNAESAGARVNGRVVGPDDGFTDFELEGIAGTNNNYTLTPRTTPYSQVSGITGIDWQTLDKAWLELNQAEDHAAAEGLRRGLRPPLESFSAPLQAVLAPHYTRLAQEARTPGAATPPSAAGTPAAPAPPPGLFVNGGPIPGKVFDTGNGGTGVRVSGMDIDIDGANNSGSVVNGRVIGAENGFSDFRLAKIPDTHNNYTLLPNVTPYDALAQASGIEWTQFDKVWLQLNAQESTRPWAQRMLEGTLPPFAALPEGELRDSLQPRYLHLMQQAAIRHNTTPAELSTALAALQASDPEQASRVLLGQASLDVDLDQAVDAAHRVVQVEVYEPRFATAEGISLLAQVYSSSTNLPQEQGDALRTTLTELATAAGKQSEFEVTVANISDAGPAEQFPQLALLYTDARNAHGDTTAVTELGQVAALSYIRDLSASSAELIEASGHQAAYARIETRLDDPTLSALPIPLQQPLRVAIVNELARINAQFVTADPDAPRFSGDAASDATLLAANLDNAGSLLSTSIQADGLEQGLSRLATAVHRLHGTPDGARALQAFHAAVQELPDDMAFKNAERATGTHTHLQAIVNVESAERALYGDEAPITRMVETLFTTVDSNTAGSIGGIDIRVAPLIDYSTIEQLPDVPHQQLWRYFSDEALQDLPGTRLHFALRGLDDATLDMISAPASERPDLSDPAVRQQLADAHRELLSSGVPLPAPFSRQLATDEVVVNLAGKNREEQRLALVAYAFAPGPDAGPTTSPGLHDSPIGNFVLSDQDTTGVFHGAALGYVLDSANPVEQRTRIDEVLTSGRDLDVLRGAVAEAGAIAFRKEFIEEAGPRDGVRATHALGTPIPFIPRAVDRTVEYGLERGVLSEDVQEDTARAALGLVERTASDTDAAPPRRIDEAVWATAVVARIPKEEAGEFTALQIATSLNYVNGASTLGEQQIRAEKALQALVTTHKVGAPPVSLAEIERDMISVDESWHEVRSRHYDKIAPYIGLSQQAGEERLRFDFGDWVYQIKTDENGNVLAANVKERSDTPSTDVIVSGVLTVLSVLPTPIQPYAAFLNSAYQTAKGIEEGNPLQIATGIMGMAGGSWATAADVLKAGDALNTAIETGDGWAIAAAGLTFAGAVSDGIGVVSADLEMGEISASFQIAAASMQIGGAIANDDLALGLRGLANLAGGLGARKESSQRKLSDKDIDIKLYDYLEKNLNVAAKVAAIDFDDPFKAVGTLLYAAGTALGSFDDLTGKSYFGDASIDEIVAGLNTAGGFVSLVGAVRDDNLADAFQAAGKLAESIRDTIEADNKGKGLADQVDTTNLQQTALGLQLYSKVLSGNRFGAADLADKMADAIPDPQPTNDKSVEELETGKVMALISDDVYKDNGFSEHDKELKALGVERLTGKDLADETGLKEEDLHTKDSGYYSAVYHDKNRDVYIIANRGTNPSFTEDMPPNVENVAGYVAHQHEFALNAAKKVTEGLGRNVKGDVTIEFTGHSLGGGLAAAQALHTGNKAYTFNAAGLSDRTISELGLSLEHEGNIDAYYVEGDLVSSMQDNPVFDLLLGVPATVVKDAIESGQSIVGNNSDPNFEAISIPSAQGNRTTLTAVDKEGDRRTRSTRTGPLDQLGLHAIGSVVSSFDYEIERAGGGKPNKVGAVTKKAAA